MLTSIKGVIFDLDGTLIDSMWLWKEIDIEYLGKRNIAFDKSLQEAIEGMTFHETAVYIKERFNISDTIDEMKEEWHFMAKEHYEKNVPLKPGAGEFLAHLKNVGIKIGIATSNSRELCEIALNSLGINEYFDHVTTGNDVSEGKPSPFIYITTAAAINVEPDNCLVFEDVPMGILAGKRAGMKVCAVEDDFSRHLRETKADIADYFIKDFNDVMEKI